MPCVVKHETNYMIYELEDDIITSWDDGREQDLRLAELLRKYMIPAIFYIPSNCDLNQKEILSIAKDFQIGGHTVNHSPDMKLLNEEQTRYEVEDNRKWLRELTKQEVTSFCYPRGRFNDMTKRVVEEAGYTEARTTKVLYVERNIEDRFETNTAIHVYPNRTEYEGKSWLELAKQLYYKAGEVEGVFHLWGHSWEVDKFGLWEELEEFFKFIDKDRK